MFVSAEPSRSLSDLPILCFCCFSGRAGLCRKAGQDKKRWEGQHFSSSPCPAAPFTSQTSRFYRCPSVRGASVPRGLKPSRRGNHEPETTFYTGKGSHSTVCFSLTAAPCLASLFFRYSAFRREPGSCCEMSTILKCEWLGARVETRAQLNWGHWGSQVFPSGSGKLQEPQLGIHPAAIIPSTTIRERPAPCSTPHCCPPFYSLPSMLMPYTLHVRERGERHQYHPAPCHGHDSPPGSGVSSGARQHGTAPHAHPVLPTSCTGA